MRGTSVLCNLSRTSLSTGGTLGMCPYGQQVRKPVILASLLLESVTKASKCASHLWEISLEPVLRNFYLRSYDSDPRGQPVGDHPCPNISSLTLSKDSLFWLLSSLWECFVIVRWHKMWGMSISSLIFLTVARWMARYWSVCHLSVEDVCCEKRALGRVNAFMLSLMF